MMFGFWVILCHPGCHTVSWWYRTDPGRGNPFSTNLYHREDVWCNMASIFSDAQRSGMNRDVINGLPLVQKLWRNPLSYWLARVIFKGSLMCLQMKRTEAETISAPFLRGFLQVTKAQAHPNQLEVVASESIRRGLFFGNQTLKSLAV